MGEGSSCLVFIYKVIGNSLTSFLVDVIPPYKVSSSGPHFSEEETEILSYFSRAKLGEAGIELWVLYSEKEPG